MIPWLLLACARPTVQPVPPPALEPLPIVSRVDGWSVLRADGDHYWTELWDAEAAALAAEARAEGLGIATVHAPPDPSSPDLDRRLLRLLDTSARPRAWQLPSRAGPLRPVAPELVGGQILARSDGALGLRLWFRPLDDAAPSLAITDWQLDGPAPTGLLRTEAGVDPACDCVPLPMAHSTLVTRASSASSTAELRFDHGGIQWFAANSERPAHAVGWFGQRDQRWLLVRPTGQPQAVCLARFPETDAAIRPRACVPNSPPE